MGLENQDCARAEAQAPEGGSCKLQRGRYQEKHVRAGTVMWLMLHLLSLKCPPDIQTQVAKSEAVHASLEFRGEV